MNDMRRIEVDVEPLSDARVARLRQQVLSAAETERRAVATRAMETPRRWNVVGPIAGLGSFVAAAVIAALVTRAWLGRGVADDTRLATTESPSHMTVGESALDVAPRSAVLVHGDDARGIDVVLDRGEVTCEVAPRKGRPAFVVDAGEVRVRVVGTRFTVTRDGSGARVAVDHGAVEVTSRGVVTMLHDGESWPAAPTAAATAPVPSAIATNEPSGTIEASDTASPAPAPSAPRSRPHHRAAPAPIDAPPVADDPAPIDAPPVAAPPASSPSPSSASASRELFESAARVEASQPDRAAALYRQIADGGSAWAPNALYALARLDADRGRPGDARRLLRDYLARYPAGPNAQDARDLLQRLP